MSAYEPGTVAVATVDDEQMRVFRTSRGWADQKGYHWVDDYSGGRIEDVRPLVVLDLAGNGYSAEGFAHLLRTVECEVTNPTDAALVGFIADQIEAQTKPPRIPEPGLWGVVEGRDGNRWVRISTLGSLDWRHIGSRVVRNTDWSYICDSYAPVTLIREGVES